MSEKSIEYWENRAQEAMKAESMEDEKVVKEIERIITLMIADIEKEIMAFYAKYATKEGISLAEAKKKIDATDIETFKARVKEYVKNKDFSDKANEELRQFNTKMYVSREEMLKMQLSAILVYATAQSEQTLYSYMEDSIYKELERQAGILGEAVLIKPETVKAIIYSSFYGHVWSTTLWKDMKKTQKQVEKMASHMLLRGRHPNEFVKDFRKLSGNSTYEIKRLLLTEATRSRTLAQKEYFKETLGEDGTVKYVAKLDERTSSICRKKNGDKIKVKDIKPGVNAPPMHPFCRSFLVETLPDWREKFFEERKGKYSGLAKVRIGGKING